MLPRHLIPQSPAPDTFSVAMNTSSDGGEEDTSTKAPEESPCMYYKSFALLGLTLTTDPSLFQRKMPISA